MLQTRLEGTGTSPTTGLATAAYLALALQRPLFREGEAGVGKTSLAAALGELLSAQLIRLQCYEGIDASQALYDWDFPRQLLHLRAVEAAGTASDEATVSRLDSEVYSRRFLLARPLLAALETTPCVLLVDEVDRADDEFEAFLLEVLSDYSVTIPELGTVTRRRAARRGAHLQPDPRGARRAEAALPVPLGGPPEVRARGRDRPPAGARRERHRLPSRWPPRRRCCARRTCAKPPGVAETIDWAQALVALGAEKLDPDLATPRSARC